MESYFADESRVSARPIQIEAQHQLPSTLFPANYGNDCILIYGDDSTSVRYIGAIDDLGGIAQADECACANLLTYYFEVTVLNAVDMGSMAIGFEQEYHKTNGGIFGCRYYAQTGHIESYRGHELVMQGYTTGDTIGMGINFISQEFFFTKNGVEIGTAPKYFTYDLFPTIILNTRNEEIAVNFGPGDFVFNYQAYETRTRDNRDIQLGRISIPRSLTHQFVRNYLSHYGYENTHESFEMATSDGPQEEDEDLNFRRILRQNIMAGNIQAAITQLEQRYPDFSQEKKDVNYLLGCQGIVESIRNGEDQGDIEEIEDIPDALSLTHLYGECCGLNENRDEENLAYLLDDAQREVVADAVNAAVRDSTNDPLYCRLENLMKQLKVCTQLLKNKEKTT